MPRMTLAKRIAAGIKALDRKRTPEELAAARERFCGPLHVEVVADARKTKLCLTLEALHLPWSFDTPECVMEAVLRRENEHMWDLFIRAFGTRAQYNERCTQDSKAQPARFPEVMDEPQRGPEPERRASMPGTWKSALDKYQYPADLTQFNGAPNYPGWFDLRLDPGDCLQTMGFEARFRIRARRHLEAWAEVVFWKLYNLPLARNKITQQVLDSDVSPAHLWSSCMDYIETLLSHRTSNKGGLKPPCLIE